FPLSDHADFKDLCRMVELVKPGKIYTLHGFAADFAQTLRGLGYQAQALSENEQFVLNLETSKNFVERATNSSGHATAKSEHGAVPDSEIPADCFLRFAWACKAVASDSRKLEKIRNVAEYLRLLSPREVALSATWLSGRPFPSSQNR